MILKTIAPNLLVWSGFRIVGDPLLPPGNRGTDDSNVWPCIAPVADPIPPMYAAKQHTRLVAAYMSTNGDPVLCGMFTIFEPRQWVFEPEEEAIDDFASYLGVEPATVIEMFKDLMPGRETCSL